MITVTMEVGGNGFDGPRRTNTEQVNDDRNLAQPGEFVYVRFTGGKGRTQRGRRGGAQLWFVPKEVTS